MEKEIGAGNPMTPEMVAAAYKSANTMGLSGSMYMYAKQALISSWKYGPELQETADQ
jgi:hypothetical protein